MFYEVAAKLYLLKERTKELLVSNQEGDTNLVSIGLWIVVIAGVISAVGAVFGARIKAIFSSF